MSTHDEKGINTMFVYVKYEESLNFSEREGGSYGSWSESYDSTVTSVGVLKDGEDQPYDSENFQVADGSTKIYVVYMIYSTGNSFGNADGKISIIHAFSNSAAAHALAKEITENPGQDTFNYKDDLGKDQRYWNVGSGYFERISYVEVLPFDLENQPRRYRVN